MTERGLFATGSAVEIASIGLPDGVVIRVGRATDSYGKVAKGELFLEAFRNGSFTLHAPLKPDTPAKADLRSPDLAAVVRIARWGLSDEPPTPANDGHVSRFHVSVPEGLVWFELPTA